MKIYTKLLLQSSILFLLLSSCAPTKSSSKTTKTFDVAGGGIVQNPLIVDLEVKETKVNGTATGYSSSIKAVKQAAVANAISAAGADVLVEPRYSSETVNSQVTVIATGYPATYKNFRALEQEDLPLLEAGASQTANVQEYTEIKTKKKGLVGVVIAGLGALLLILIIAAG